MLPKKRKSERRKLVQHTLNLLSNVAFVYNWKVVEVKIERLLLRTISQ